MFKSTSFQILLCGLVALNLTACNSGGDDSTTESNSSNTSTNTQTSNNTNQTNNEITIQFKGMVSSENFKCGSTYKPIGSAIQDSYKINDFRLYLSQLKLLNQHTNAYSALTLKEDGKWQTAKVAMLDFEEGCLNGTAETNTTIVATAPTGTTATDYNGICFTLGLPFDENHSDPTTAASPLNTSGMLWSWTTGHKFLRIDGIGDPDNLKASFVVHLGSTGCSDVNKQGKQPDGVCSYPNTPEICLSNFNSKNNTIKVDIAQILKESNIVYNTPNTAAGCMSGNNDPECQTILPLLGIDFTYNDGVNPAVVYPKKEQKFFTVQ